MSDPSLAITTPEAPLWWISWYQPGGDCRPMSWPPPEAILCFWCTGWTLVGDSCMVAVVRAPTAEQARAEVTAERAWPDAGEQRFCQPIDHPPGDRFPPPTDGPMVERWPWPATLR